MTKVTIRGGVITDARTRDMVDEVFRITPNLPTLMPIFGSYQGNPNSAGTHLGSGAVDFSVDGFSLATCHAYVGVLRKVGFAAWYRPPNWNNRGGKAHIHAIAIGAPGLSTAAKGQVNLYAKNLNGLANNGPDNENDGPNVLRTWEQYLIDKANAAKPKPVPKPRAINKALPWGGFPYPGKNHTGMYGRAGVRNVWAGRMRSDSGVSVNYAISQIQRAVGDRPTGVWSSSTTSKVKMFQAKHKLAADGFVGPVTWAAMVVAANNT